MRHLIIFALLSLSVFGTVYGLHGEAPVRTTLLILGGLIGLVVAYILLLLSFILTASALRTRSPKWAERILRLQGRLFAGETHAVALLELHLDNPEKCDSLWKEVEPGLPALNPDQTMALALNYSVSLSRRGQLSRARDLMLEYPPQLNSVTYRHHYALYWLNLGWYQQELGDREQAEYCLRRALLEKLTHVPLKQRQESLQALLAHQAGDRQEALRSLREHPRKWACHAWLMAELGEMEEAANRLPDLSTTQDVIDRTYHHLTMALIHKDPAELEQASLSGFCSGKVAYYGVTLFDDVSYLPKALERDPESRWTRRAAELESRA